MKIKKTKKTYSVVLDEDNWAYLQYLKARTGFSISERLNSWITEKKQEDEKNLSSE